MLAVYALAGGDPIVRLFFWLTVLGGLGVLILMVATSIAVIAYVARPANRVGLGTGRGMRAPIIATVALGAVLVVTLDQFATLLGVHPTSDLRWQLPAAYAAAATLGIVWALILKTTRPETYATIGAVPF